MANRPRNIAVSVRQRLLDLAQKEGQAFHVVLVAFGLERFLYRLSESAHRDRFVLKGNYMRKCATNMFGPGFPMIIYKFTLVVKNSVSVLPTNPHISIPRSAFAKLCPPLAHFRM